MFRNREEWRRRLLEIIERFRQKGAISPEKAMTVQELGLPPRFEEAMHRRLGQSGIFVEVNGRYYLNEERLRQIREQRAQGRSGSSGGGGGSSRAGPPSWFGVVGIFLMLPIGIIIAVVLFYFVSLSGIGLFPGEFLVILAIVLVGVTVARLLFWRYRRRYWREHQGRTEQSFVRYACPRKASLFLLWEVKYSTTGVTSRFSKSFSVR